jgi:hypothetical protein
MKKYVNLFFVVLLACNNQSSHAPATTTAAISEAIKPAPNSNGCGNLALFRKGAIMQGISYDDKGKETARQTTTIANVTEAGGVTTATANIEMFVPGAKTRTNTMTYKCDGTNLYMDMNALVQNVTALTGSKVTASTIQFPLNIKAGETLPEASYTITMNAGGKPMEITTTYKERTVGPKQKITTPAGSWNCYEVNSVASSEMKGMDEKMKKAMEAVKDKMKMRMVMWYAPDFGIIKTDTYMGGQLKGHSEIVSIKY